MTANVYFLYYTTKWGFFLKDEGISGCAAGILAFFLIASSLTVMFPEKSDVGMLLFWSGIFVSWLVYSVVANSIAKLKASRQEKILEKELSELEKLKKEIKKLDAEIISSSKET